jgi:tRNA(Ile)-lysidine synthase
MSLESRFDRHLAAMGLPPGPALVAVSGGPDSLALLALLVRSPAAAELTLHVAHADHGLHPMSGQVAGSVERVAAEYGLPWLSTRLVLPADGSETAARAARYDWLFGEAARLGAATIFTGHHRNDQVETILMRALRGSGPAGLAGMAPRRGRITRPLLRFGREELAGYLNGLGRSWWEDPANRNPVHQRSWIRTTVLPALRTGLPDVDRRLLALGRQAASNRAAWDALLGQIPGLDLQSLPEGVSVAATPLRGYDSAILRALLGALGRQAGCLIGPARATRIERLLARGRSGAVAELGAGFAAELSFGRLRLFREVGHRPLWGRTQLDGDSGTLELGSWRLDWRPDRAPATLERGQTVSWFAKGSYVVRPWRAGDRIRPLGSTGRRLVVRCMQDAKVPRSLRVGWPVLESAGTVVWVPGVTRSAECVAAPGAPALRIDAQAN